MKRSLVLAVLVVAVQSACGGGGGSPGGPVGSPPQAPGGLGAQAVSDTSIALAWLDLSSDETGFRVERSGTSGSVGFAEVAVVGANVTAWVDTGLVPGSTSWYRVRAYNASGSSAFTSVASATTLAFVAAPPVALVATAQGPTEILLTWSAGSQGQTGFVVERSTTSATAGFADVGTVSGATTSWLDTGLAAVTPYWYRVRATYSYGTSVASSPATAITWAPAPPVAPYATAQGPTEILVTWSAGYVGQTSFVVERSTTSSTAGFASAGTVSGATTSWLDLGLAAATEYWYRVRAVYPYGTSDASSPATATTWTPAPPVGLYATAQGPTEILVAWNAGYHGQSGFVVERSTTSATAGFTDLATVTGAMTSWLDPGLAAGTPYWYRVRAVYPYGASAPSSPATATTWTPAPPVGLYATAQGPTEILVAWNAGYHGQTGFVVERSTTSSTAGFADLVTVSGATTSWLDTGLAAATPYWYRARAVYPYGASTPSSPATATTWVPAPPVAVFASAQGPTEILLSWSPGYVGQTGFVIARSSTSSSAGFADLATVAGTGTSYLDAGVAAGTQYWYRVRAVYPYGTSAPSDPATAITGAGQPLPPDPSTVATPIDPTVPTDLFLSTMFLYTGGNPIQTGVADGTIDPTRVAVLRGRLVGRDGAPLPGAVVSIVGNPQYGQTISRADGWYDLAVNGGSTLAVGYVRAGSLSAQRTVDVPWKQFVSLPDVTLIPLDPRATIVDLASSDPLQVARGSPVTDADGSRQATLLIPRGTQASLVLPGGATQPLGSLTLRATEYTVGPRGPGAMPAPLPTASGYTYAVELSADEALAAGAADVVFDRPLFFYVEDFIGFPVGSAVPAGYLDREKGVWVASENGRVVRLLRVAGGQAELDTDGDGNADDAATLAALGITDVERARLASTYPVTPKQLWRVPVRHFSPWDFNWAYGPPPDAEEPDPPPPKVDDKDDEFTIECASLIETQNQILAEAVTVPGTPFALNYSSDRVPGRTAGRTLEIKLSGDRYPGSVVGIRLEVDVAGRRFRQEFPWRSNLSTTFAWDGKDVYGRAVKGAATAWVSVQYGYVVVYYPVRADFDRSFSRFSPSAGFVRGPVARLVWIKKDFSVDLVSDADFHGLGGWSLDPHHVLDRRVGLFLGDGQRRSPRAMGAPLNVVSTVAGGGAGCTYYPADGSPATSTCLARPIGVGIGGDGLSFFVLDGCVLYSVDPSGSITTEAGIQYHCGFDGDGVLAWQASLNNPRGGCGVPGGGGYVADTQNHRIRFIDPDSIIHTVAGTGAQGFAGDGGPATEARLNAPSAVVRAPDGNLYIADTGNDRIRRMGPDGLITTIAGGGDGLTPCYGLSGDGGAAAAACLAGPTGLALGPDGSIYVADAGNNVIRRVRPDGVIVSIAGSGLYGLSGDGGPAKEADLANPTGVAVAPDGSLFIADADNDTVRVVSPDGIINTLAGGDQAGSDGNGIPATWARLSAPTAVALAADGSLYVADSWSNIVRRIWNPLGLSGTAYALASLDGDERYEFDLWGRHLRTADALTGSSRHEFGYDAAGRLVGITDLAGNRTTIERDAAGTPIAIVAPGGQRTSLTIGADGYLARIVKPGGETTSFAYAGGGLLASMTDPVGNVSTFDYDALGRLTSDASPGGSLLSLSRTPLLGGFQVATATAAGALASFEVMYPYAGGSRWTDRSVDGRTQTLSVAPGGTRTLTRADGTVVTSVRGPDPRFGMEAPILKSQVIRTPAGLVNTYSRELTSMPASPGAPGSYATLHSVRTVNGRSYTADVDAVQLRATTSSPAGRVTATDFDAAGRIVRTQRGDRAPVAYAYDGRGHLASMTRGTGASARVHAFAYDALGDLARVIYPDGRSVQYRHDASGRITAQVFPDGREAGYGRDARGKLVSFTPPGRPAQQISYTPSGLPATHALPAPGGVVDTLILERGQDDLVARRIRPDGTAMDYGYDTARRLVGKAAGGESIGYTYAPTGNLSSIARSGVGTITYGWDGFLRTQEQWQGAVGGSVSRFHDGDFRLIALGVNGASVALSYDQDGLLTAAGVLAIARDPVNGTVAGTSAGNVVDTRTFNEFSELVGYRATWLGAELYSARYTRDSMGRVVTRTESFQGGPAGVTSYAYDAAGRLASVTRDGALQASFTYDANGNRLSRSDAVGTVTATYDVRDRLLQYGTASYAWTGNGELLSRTAGGATTSYVYDGFGDLIGVALPGGRTVEYVVDGAGRRIGKAVDGVLTRGFLYKDAVKPVAELDGAGALVSLFVYGTSPWVPDVMLKAGRTYRLLSDHRGSVRLVVDAADGTVAQRLDYGPLGEVTLDTQPAFQPFGFAGGLYDPDTGLTRFGRRDYDAATGRWATQDPVLVASRSTNYYQYALGDPVNLHDPTGRIDESPNVRDIPGEDIPGKNGGYEHYERRDWIDIDRVCANGVCRESIRDLKAPGDAPAVVDIDLNLCSGPGCPSMEEATDQAQKALEAYDIPLPATPPPPPSAPTPETPPPPGGGGSGTSPGAGAGGGRACSMNIWRDSSGNVIRRVKVPQ